VQFHPEVHHTPLGAQLIKNFVFSICGAAGDWTPAHFIESTVAAIREKVGKGHVICGLSGGVDSSVAAVLVHRAIGSQLTCIFVNNGVLRKNEFQSVQKNLRDKLGLKIVAVDASERFLSKLAGVTEPEKKSKIIGAEFIAVFDDEATRIAKEPVAPWTGWSKARSTRRDRIQQRQRPQPDHQEPPQRRRPAAGHEAQADRAPARPLQRRSPPHRPRPRKCRTTFLAASPFPAPAWPCASWAK
jgi:hypothetical protein